MPSEHPIALDQSATFAASEFEHAAEPAMLAARLNDLQSEADQLRAERDRLADQQKRIAELLKSQDPQKIVHDLRNVLNELNLYKLLVETTSSAAKQ